MASHATLFLSVRFAWLMVFLDAPITIISGSGSVGLFGFRLLVDPLGALWAGGGGVPATLVASVSRSVGLSGFRLTACPLGALGGEGAGGGGGTVALVDVVLFVWALLCP